MNKKTKKKKHFTQFKSEFATMGGKCSDSMIKFKLNLTHKWIHAIFKNE